MALTLKCAIEGFPVIISVKVKNSAGTGRLQDAIVRKVDKKTKEKVRIERDM
ncbi:hypothetical protein PC129_g737 [Phytophthora cactorum]|uniref:Uncharacterized protein n=1 Tax=Phytophthora cactorum TaxID=29920 RepID=A0A8T1IX00_9STRA|nr:hypothetical protein Pcac1_g239 [Phytophthora cactorum]KAG2805174.1 hypothetical protein PC111_g17929 [Phytophthora cactorum]KAG2849121.1 hypothetical protein PC112_g473 [Phytophthora cactorum]KAG2934973.1 hypothetical protein PC114_g841 [Phytophthora cactorum]KAG2944323.1 hypothetical protein PC115_g438 [Phytophthora cactorum]